jgi:hypothetical protein
VRGAKFTKFTGSDAFSVNFEAARSGHLSISHRGQRADRNISGIASFRKRSESAITENPITLSPNRFPKLNSKFGILLDRC